MRRSSTARSWARRNSPRTSSMPVLDFAVLRAGARLKRAVPNTTKIIPSTTTTSNNENPVSFRRLSLWYRKEANIGLYPLATDDPFYSCHKKHYDSSSVTVRRYSLRAFGKTCSRLLQGQFLAPGAIFYSLGSALALPDLP